MTSARAALLAIACAAPLLAGCPASEAPRVAPDLAALAALDTSLAAWLPLGPGAQDQRVRCAWNDGQAVPLVLTRGIDGWEVLPDGRAWARVVTALDHPKRRDVYLVEWVRPAVDRVLCARRQVGQLVIDLDPPQPVLVAPVASGATWTWTGTAGGRPASTTCRVAGVEPRHAPGPTDPPPDPASLLLRVEQSSTVAGPDGAPFSSRGQRWYARGQGLVEEQGAFPVGEPNHPEDKLKARLDDAGP